MEEKLLQNLLEKLKKYVLLNKMIIDCEGVAEVVASNLTGRKLYESDYKKDYLMFCFTKFSKSLKSILYLIEMELHEDALILTRSNYECMIHAKALVNNGEMINHFIHYKLGLEEEKYYEYFRNKKKRIIRSIIVDKLNPNIQINYFESIRTIAIEAKEETSYEHVYGFLCEITHCNFLTSGYYREKAWYNMDISSQEARVNVLFCNFSFILKMYEAIIESDLLDDEEEILEDTLASIVIEDKLILHKYLESEEKRFINYYDKEDEEILTKYLNTVRNFKEALLN